MSPKFLFSKKVESSQLNRRSGIFPGFPALVGFPIEIESHVYG